MDCNKTHSDVTKEKEVLEQLKEKMRIKRRKNIITKLQVESDVLRRRNVGGTKYSPISKVSLLIIVYLYQIFLTHLKFKMVFKIITLWEFQVQQLTSTYTLTSFLHKLVDGNRERLDIVAELFSNQLCANSLQMETLVSLYSAHHDWYSYKTIAKLLPRFVLFIFVVLNKY